MQHSLSRRTLLKLSGGILAAAPFVRVSVARAQLPKPVQLEKTRRPFGRAMANNIPIRETADVKAALVRSLKWNDVISLIGQVTAPGPTSYNSIWYATTEGFVHSAFIHPTENLTHAPIEVLPKEGQWCEISVPVTEGRSRPDAKAPVRDRFVFGMTFRAVSVVMGADKTVWYQLSDEFAGSGFYAKAEHIRLIPAEEFTPLSPNVAIENKRIDVNIKEQTVIAYEFDKPVFNARVATGGKYNTPDGIRNYFTTPGEHRVFRKIAGQRMFGGTPGFDYYNLPGVPWVSYFTFSGIAFHGAYWHNDFGRPRSHGCVNMLPEDAQWVFRWTMPVAAPEDKMVKIAKREEGSLIKVF